MVLSVTIAATNVNGNGYAGLDFGQSGGYVPPDTCGAAGPSAYVETVNQTIALSTSKSAGSPNTTSSLSTFWFTTGGLAHADSRSGLSDPIVAYNDQIGRFIVGDQDVDSNTHVSTFDIAVSKSDTPTALDASNWTFYQINTTESGYNADYPGNFGYNHDAFVFTLNMFGTTSDHAMVVSVSNADLYSGVSQSALHVYKNDINDFSIRPTTMHDSVAGDPMWLVTEHGDGKSIDVVKDTSVLSSSPTFTYTNLPVTPYSSPNHPLNPDGTVITTNIDSRIMKAAEWNGTLVASHSVAASSTEDDAQWYAINVGGATPTLTQQGRVSAGNNTYITYPTIDVNSSGQIGMTYMKSGNDTSTDYLSMYVTGRDTNDGAGTMETPVLVPAGTGLANYKDFSSGGRAGDLSGINVDPSDKTSFWAANEYADTESTANWSTAIANFTIGSSLPSTDMAVTVSGPPSVTAGTSATYTITITNNGPNAASGVVLTDTLPTGATFGSISQTGNDPFTFAQSGGSVTETAKGSIASGASDTFSLVVSAPSNLANGADFSDTATVQASNPDPNSANNTSTASGTISNPNSNADLSVSISGPSSSPSEGDTVQYTITVTNAGPAGATGVTLTDPLPSLLAYVSATGPGLSVSGNTVTFNIGSLASAGQVTVTVNAQALEEGSISNSASVTASSPDPTSSNNTTSVVTSFADPPINVSSAITVKQPNLNNYQTATFTHANGVEPPGAFSASIDWGDNTTSAGTITLSGTTYTVTGSHRYQSRGNHTITTTVIEVGGNAVDKYDGGDYGHAWRAQDVAQLPGDAHGSGGSAANAAAGSPSIAIGSAAVTQPIPAAAGAPLATSANDRSFAMSTPGASGTSAGTSIVIGALDPSVLSQGDSTGIGSAPSWATPAASARRRFGTLLS